MVAKREAAGNSTPRRRPAPTPEDREKQLGSYAFDLAEKQLLNGSASPGVITHFLKAVSIREKLELEQKKSDNMLTQAKIAQSGQADRMEGLLRDAMQAFTVYKGGEQEDDEDEDY